VGDPVLVGAGLGALVGLFTAAALSEAVSSTSVAARWARLALEPLLRAGREGYEPSRPQRRRLGVAGAVLAACAGLAMFGPAVAVGLALAGPYVARRSVEFRRARYRRRVDASLPEIANAMADALAAGRSLRAALSDLAGSLDGAAATEFAVIGAELDLGAPTEQAVAGLTRRIGSPRVEAFASALLAGRRSGGDLAGLMRRFAAGAEAHDRAARDARSATAQARFTGLLVAAMPAGAALFVELLRPGFIGGLLGSPVSIVLLGVAAGFQLAGFLAIRRLAREPA